VEAEEDGYVLEVLHRVDDRVAVGSTFMWLGGSADEPIPDSQEVHDHGVRRVEPTAKARALLAQYGVTADEVPVRGDRLTVADIEAFLARTRGAARANVPSTEESTFRPEAAGARRPLSPEERGMLHAVGWHRTQAVPGYIEIEYDPRGWIEHAAQYAAHHKLLMSPLLPLLAYRLTTIVAKRPKLNSTIVEGELYEYEHVNLGFTVQVADVLYMVVVRKAETLDEQSFVAQLGELQRKAMAKRLPSSQLSGASVAFSSMARWNVMRHVPILPPYSSLIVAHAGAVNADIAVLGASYDHRVLSGFDVSQVLLQLARP
jgi:pyruvate/2-oxoglutarate dehydrogenase complex dihydrolipoamide acyltransferase (E2) component